MDLSIQFVGPKLSSVSEIKFSPDDATLAVGGFDGVIYLFNTADWSLRAKCEGHSAGITHFDFSADATHIQSNSRGGELLYFLSETGAQEPSPSQLKDTVWATQTCIFGWPVQGIWPKFADGTDVNAVDYSKRANLLVTGDDFGLVKLARYPCLTPSTDKQLVYRGHSAHVSCVRFNSASSYVVSVGGSDRCVFQWRLVVDQGEEEMSPEGGEGDEGYGSSDGEDMVDGEALVRSAARELRNDDDLTALIDMEEERGAGSAGEGFMAVKPWQSSVYSPYELGDLDKTLPDDDLALEWVHGYAAQDSRSNLFYNPKGELVYPAASVAVVLNKQSWAQRFMRQHTDDIVSTARHPDGVHFATAQLGRSPMIVVWNSLTCEAVRVMKLSSVRAVSAMAFSHDGVLLAAAGQDDLHTVFVYEWATGTVLCRGKGGARKVLSMGFMADNTTLVCGGRNHFMVWEINGVNMMGRRGVYGKQLKVQSVLSVAALADGVLLGLENGSVGRVSPGDTKIDAVYPAHEKAVNTIYVLGHPMTATSVVSGSRDGTIKVWSPDLDLKYEINMATYCPKLTPAVRSVSLNQGGDVLLVGLRSGQVFELDITRAEDGDEENGVQMLNGGPLIASHFRGELWGLAVHPSKPEYVTVGDDRCVCVWDTRTHRLRQMTVVDAPARAVAYSPGGTHIVVGMGSSSAAKKQKKAGTYVVLNESDLTEVRSGRDTKSAVSDIKFSPDGTIMALGSHDNFIYLYNVADGYSLRATCDKHSSFITHFDFDRDGTILQSNCGAYELLYFDAQTGDHKPNAADFASQNWDTQTCVLGWSVQGVWPRGSDGTDVNAVDRSHDKTMVVTGDDFGKVKLFRFPCSQQGASFKEMTGHSDCVNSVRFGHDDMSVMSVGGADRCVFQWKVLNDALDEDALEAGDSGNDSDLDVGKAGGGGEIDASAVGLDGMLTMDALGGGDDFNAVKPWAGTIVEPTNPPFSNPAPPEAKLSLEWVHGVRAADVRSTVFYNLDAEPVYCASGLGVIYERAEHTQKFYSGHTEDVICLALSPCRRFVATGQKGKRPQVHVWDADTGASVCILPRYHRRGVVQVAFSADGNQIASVGDDEAHSVALYSTASGDWVDGKRVAGARNDTQKVLFAQFMENPQYPLVTGGVQHVRFWSVNGRSLVSKRGVFGSVGKLQPLPSAATMGGVLVTGTVSGHLYVWEDYTVTRAIKAHTKTVYSLYYSSVRQQLVTGGRDGRVKVFNSDLTLAQVFNLAEATPAPVMPAVRSVAVDGSGVRLIVGTRGSELYEYVIDSGLVTQLMQGHATGELWGLAANPKYKDLYATSGDDGTVRVWSLKKKALVKKVQVGARSRALAWDPAGRTIAIGLGGVLNGKGDMKDGGFMLIDHEKMEVVLDARESKGWIQDIRYSLDGATLAVASHDNTIYLHDVPAGCAVRAKCQAHSSPVTHIDFSADGSYLRSNCEGYELMFHQVDNGEQEGDAEVVKDTVWGGDTCPCSYAVQGVWGEDKTIVNAVDRNNAGTLLASVEDTGKVKLFNYPSAIKEAQSVEGKGHAGTVTNVRFMPSDTHLITIGGEDRCVFQWKVTRS